MIKKLTAIFATLTIALCLSGCEVNDIDDVDILLHPYNIFKDEVKGFIDTPTFYLEGEKNEIAEKCFESIEYCGLKLALPMNASDLPEGYYVAATYTGTNNYNGFCLSNASILQDESIILNVQVLHKKGEDISKGQIIAMTFYSTTGLPKLGDGIIMPDTSAKEIFEIFHQDSSGNYILKNGSIIDIYSTNYDYPPSLLILSCDGTRESY